MNSPLLFVPCVLLVLTMLIRPIIYVYRSFWAKIFFIFMLGAILAQLIKSFVPVYAVQNFKISLLSIVVDDPQHLLFIALVLLLVGAQLLFSPSKIFNLIAQIQCFVLCCLSLVFSQPSLILGLVFNFWCTLISSWNDPFDLWQRQRKGDGLLIGAGFLLTQPVWPNGQILAYLVLMGWRSSFCFFGQAGIAIAACAPHRKISFAICHILIPILILFQKYPNGIPLESNQWLFYGSAAVLLLPSFAAYWLTPNSRVFLFHFVCSVVPCTLILSSIFGWPSRALFHFSALFLCLIPIFIANNQTFQYRKKDDLPRPLDDTAFSALRYRLWPFLIIWPLIQLPYFCAKMIDFLAWLVEANNTPKQIGLILLYFSALIMILQGSLWIF